MSIQTISNGDKCNELKWNYIEFLETNECKTRILKYQVLTAGQINDSNTYDITIDESILYYQFVTKIFQCLKSQIKGVNFQSVELYSRTGYPLAYSPKKYIEPISEWFLRQNELIFVYLKKISVLDQSNPRKQVSSISLQIENTDVTIQVPLYDMKLFCEDLKTLVARELHLEVNAIVIKLFDVKKENATILDDRFQLEIIDIQNDLSRISIQILEYWGDNSYLSAFCSNLYTSCSNQTMNDWHHFNCLLLFLAKEGLEISKGKLFEKLGLIRNISRSPPLVYALFRLFTGLHLVLPHRIAINEGILANISLWKHSEDEPKISEFSMLWIYVETSALPEHKQSEIYLTKCIPRPGKGNPSDVEIKRLRQVFPDTEDMITIWRYSLLTPEPINSKGFSVTQTNIEERFPFRHAFELFQQFLTENITYGLVSPEVDQLSCPKVFLGRSLGMTNSFDLYSPQDGECYQYEPNCLISYSKSCTIDYIQNYPYKIFIILDISTDMYCEYEKHETCLNLATSLIELLLDRIIGLHYYYMVGVILISNNNSFPKGFLEFQQPSLEYKSLINDLEKYLVNTPEDSNSSRPSEGIIVSTLLHLTEKYPSPAELYVFTRNAIEKYYGSKINSVEAKLINSRFKINFILLPDNSSSQLRRLSEISKGSYVDKKIINSKIQFPKCFSLSSNELITHYLFGYFSHIQKQSSIIGSYNEISAEFCDKLISIENFLNRIQSEKEEYSPNLNQILKQISNYSKNPNPFCKIFSVSNDIRNHISLIQGPYNTPFQGSILFMEIRFGKDFPENPPKFCFISTCYHPNILASGEICHPILFEDYHPNITLKQIMDSIYNMLYTPVISHAVKYSITENFLLNKSLYDQINLSNIKRCHLDKSMSDCLDGLNVHCARNQSHPVNYICPLTKELLDVAVTTPEGSTYERHAIIEHLKSSQTDPITKNPLTETQLIPNNAVMAAVYKYRKTFA